MRRILGLALGVALAFVFARATHAHEVRPGFLELRETAPETYSVLWKHPAGGVVCRRLIHITYAQPLRTR